MKHFDYEMLEIDARTVAKKAHGDQSYGIFHYVYHLDSVVEVLCRFGYEGKYVVAGYLHDTLEDTNLKYRDIESYFGKDVAEMVYCVTDEIGRNRKERKEKTYPKIVSNPDAIIIKLADRIANVEEGGKVDMYRKEHKEFKSNLYVEGHCDDIWEYLETVIFEKK